MGTRNLTMVVLGGEYKVAQYGQWDGYPEGQGLQALQIMRKIVENGEIEKFKEQISAVYEITPEIYARMLWECGGTGLTAEKLVEAEKRNPLVSIIPDDVLEEYLKKYPQMSRDTGANILQLIMDAKKLFCVSNNLGFAGGGNAFACEWAYLVDLDRETLEVYTFNCVPLGKDDRFYFLQAESKRYPIKMIKSYNLNALPEDDKFVDELYRLENAFLTK